jgi:DNA-binding response OmpR family regulator
MKKILVADDDENISGSIQEILELNGYQVVTAGNGEETLKKIGVERPDLLILDLMMPEMDGASVACDLKMRRTEKQLPIIFISGMLPKDVDKTKGITEDNTAYLAKPFEVQELLALVKKIFEP